MGNLFDFFFLIVSCFLVYYAIEQAKKGNIREIRPLAALEALEESVGRAAEIGRPVHYTTGMGAIFADMAAMTIAGLSILGKVASICGKYAVRMRYTCAVSYIIPLAEDLIQAGYRSSGNADLYDPNMIVYVGEEQRSFMAGVMGYIMRERPATNLIFGAFFDEAIIQLGTGAVAGCMNIGGTARLYYLPIVACCCDYYLIGEELFVAAALVDKSAPQYGSIYGQDLVKLLVMVLININVVLTALGIDWMQLTSW